jgi:hypothetical protein
MSERKFETSRNVSFDKLYFSRSSLIGLMSDSFVPINTVASGAPSVHSLLGSKTLTSDETNVNISDSVFSICESVALFQNVFGSRTKILGANVFLRM